MTETTTQKRGPGRPPVPQWKKDGRRVLCSPSSSVQLTIKRWQRQQADDGGVINEKVEKPLDLRADTFDAVDGEGGHPDGYLAKTLVGTVEGETPDGVRRLMGSVAIITPDTASNYGMEFDELVAQIEKKPLYGHSYAFTDDEEGMARLGPRFADWDRQRRMDAEDQTAVLQNMGERQVGPELRKVDPRYEPQEAGKK